MAQVDKKSELLEVYDMNEDFIGVRPRGQIYEEIEAEYSKTGKITKQLRTVRALILNTKGRVLLQKRSEDKSYNAGLYDKTLGGHCIHRQPADLSLVQELAEELQAPGFVCGHENYLYSLRQMNLEVIGLFKNIDYTPNWMSFRKGNPKVGATDMEQPLMNHFYFGVYAGRFTWSDEEVRGMDSFTLDELTHALVTRPDDFTHDLHSMMPMYLPHIESVLDKFGISFTRYVQGADVSVELCPFDELGDKLDSTLRE